MLYGVVDFVKAATREGVNPIIGMEAYLTPDRDSIDFPEARTSATT